MRKILIAILAVNLLCDTAVLAQNGAYSGPPVTFSQLSAIPPTQGASLSCTNCNVTGQGVACTGGGTGAIAIGSPTQWSCVAYGTNGSSGGGITGVTAGAHGGITIANGTTAPVASQSQQIFYPQDYGANFTGTGDDSGAIQAAITGANSWVTIHGGHAVVAFPTGMTAKVTSGITVPDLVGIDGNGAKLDCSSFSSGACLTVTGAASAPELYRQNLSNYTRLELVGPGSGTAGVIGLSVATTNQQFENINVHDFANDYYLGNNNTFNDSFLNCQGWNAGIIISTGTNNPSQSGETFSFTDGDFYNSTTGVSMLNTGGGMSINFVNDHFDGLSGSAFVLATGASETAQVNMYGGHIEYTSAATAADMVQIGGGNFYTSFTAYGTNFQTDAGNINSIVNDSGVGQVYINHPFLSIGGYTTGQVIGTGAANVAIENGYTGSVLGVTHGTVALPSVGNTGLDVTNGTGNAFICALGAGNQYAIFTNGVSCPAGFGGPGLFVDDAGNDYLIASAAHNVNISIANTAGIKLGSTNILAQGGETLESSGGSVPTGTCSGGSTGVSFGLNSTNNRGSMTTSSSASTNCTITWSASGSWTQPPYCVFTDGSASITPTSFSTGACGGTTCIFDFASATSKVVNYVCL